MGKVKLLPELRFPGFEGEWEKKKLKEVTTKINSGKTPLGGEAVYTSDGILFIRSQNVFNDNLDLNNSTYIPVEINEGMKNSIVEANDILLNITGASLGRSCVVPNDFSIGNVNQHVCIIRLDKHNNPRFIQPIFSSPKGQNLFQSLQTGSGREGLNFESIKGIELFFPSLPEQTRIATFLTSVDKRISLLIQKKEKLVCYKQGVMQKIFSQELRFKDEDGKDFPEWEEKRLGDVCTKQSSNISANSLCDNSGVYKIYGATGFLQYVDFYREEESYISIVKDGAGVGRVLKCDPKSSVLGTLDILKPHKSNVIDFLYLLLLNLDFTKYVTGSTIPHIYFKDYSSENISLPSKEEQIRIAAFLTALDQQIEKVDAQIGEMKGWKKGLLQKMFV